MSPTIDEAAVELAVRRLTRRQRWSRERALDECRRVAEKHGCDGEASVAEAARRIDAAHSVRRQERQAFERRRCAHREEIRARWPMLTAYRVVLLSDGLKSRVFYCRDDDRAVAMSDYIRLRGRRGKAVQVVRLLPDGRDALVTVVSP